MPTERSYQQVLSGIESDLTAGRLTVGGKLPGERGLAERFDVSRASVREALRILDALGMVSSATGSGPTAGATVTADLAAPIAAALRWNLASSAVAVDDLVQARVLTETWCAVTASSNRGDDPPTLADGVADRLDGYADPADADPGDFLLAEAEFSAALAAAAGNTVVGAVLGAVRAALDPLVASALVDRGDWPVLATRWRNDLTATAAAVDAGDADRAADLVASRIYQLYGSTGLLAGPS